MSILWTFRKPNYSRRRLRWMCSGCRPRPPTTTNAPARMGRALWNSRSNWIRPIYSFNLPRIWPMIFSPRLPRQRKSPSVRLPHVLAVRSAAANRAIAPSVLAEQIASVPRELVSVVSPANARKGTLAASVPAGQVANARRLPQWLKPKRPNVRAARQATAAADRIVPAVQNKLLLSSKS